jgi:Uma2 family endonuclease
MRTATKPRQSRPARPKPPASFFLRQWTVAQYHDMIDKNILTPDDRVELLEGWIVEKMPQNTPHSSSIRKLRKSLTRILPSDWDLDSQCPITLATSEPEPDLAIVAVSPDDYEEHHPGPDDVGVIIEVSDTSIAKDRIEKARIYAEAGIPEYWIVDVKKGIIEVYSNPTNGKKWRYRTVKQYRKADSIPLILRGKKVADIPLRDILK